MITSSIHVGFRVYQDVATDVITYYTSYLLIKCIEEYYGNTSLVRYGGTDGDRSFFYFSLTNSDVARAANATGAYVLTKSSSYFVLPVPGVISVDWLLEEYANPGTSSFPLFTKKRQMFTAFWCIREIAFSPRTESTEITSSLQ